MIEGTRVVHVVDRTTGGVPVAVGTYIATGPASVDHTLIALADEQAAFVPGFVGPTIWLGSAGPYRALRTIRALRREIARLAPDVVHAHSSFAGLYTRLALGRRGPAVVYSPHCFAFERRDVSAPVREGFRAVERALMRRTDLLAACGPGEARLARALGAPAERVIVVPNVTSLGGDSRSGRAAEAGSAGGATDAASSPSRSLAIGMLGRASPQKDPAYFAAAIQGLRVRLGADFPLEARWIGDGDDTATLDAARIDRTGWLAGDALRGALGALDLYLHSAAWEGFPIAVLDAHAAGAPMLVRPIGAFADVPRELTIDSGLDSFVDAARQGCLNEWSARNRTAWAEVLRDNTPERQRDALARVWAAQSRERVGVRHP